ncbi:MAG: ABC transporter ATP-binding protein [Thermoprotei archaeon]
MTDVKLENVTKKFGNVIAVDNVNLNIQDGELFTLLGPSGCGKTTLLRIIAGLEYPDKGKIFFGGNDVTLIKSYERNVAMVFQNYALWPHMTVFDNIAFGLKIKKLPKSEIKERVWKVLDLVQLSGLENRYPTQLSGGQQQRVALARALVVEPKLLLLDEPLSNLDAKLRIEMREEIKRIQKNLKITTIYVTHDQEEAMSISDRIAILDKGKVLQVGTPKEIYEKPQNLFVASFIGRSSILKGVIKEITNNYALVSLGDYTIKGLISSNTTLRPGDSVAVILRPEDFKLNAENDHNIIEGDVDMVMFLGSYQYVRLKLVDDSKILIKLNPNVNIRVGQKLKTFIEVDQVNVLPWD